MVRASLHINVCELFVDFDICHRMVPLRELYSVTVTYFLKVKTKKFNNSQTVRANAKICLSHLKTLTFAIESFLKLVLCDLHLYFVDQQLKILISVKQ